MGLDYFEFYEIPRSFQIDANGLRAIFLKNSKRYHPDFHTLESEDRQAEILHLSTLNNEAYKTLNDFDLRMKYLLSLEGTLEEEGKNQIPQEFLMEMMDINESIMELQFDFDAATYEKSIKNLEAIEKSALQNVMPAIESYDAGTSDELQLQNIKDYYLKKRYLLRIRENLDKFASL